MSKLEQIKTKVSELKSKLVDKLEHNPLLKKLRTRSASAAATSGYGLTDIYKTGTYGTKFKVWLVYFFMIIGFMALGISGKRLLSKLNVSKENDKLQKQYAEGFEAFQERVQENASIVSIGSLTANAHSDENASKFLKLDLWVKTSDASAADFVRKNEPVFNDKAASVLNQLYQENIDLLSDEGKRQAKDRMLKELNLAMRSGQIVDLYFYNLVFQ